MGYNNNGTDDLEKLRIAFRQIATQFGSLEDILNAFGLSQLPTAQRYGIFFGCLVFCCTILAVIALLILGGTFQRIAAQEAGTDDSIVTSHDARAQRALLMEKLLEGRERMVQTNYPPPVTTIEPTNLTKMLLNQVVVVKKSSSSNNHHTDGENEENKNQQNASKKNDKKKQNTNSGNKKSDEQVTADDDEQEQDKLYTLYKDSYTEAYRHCQDRMGGAVLSGRPEARFEAYARSYAGCGPYCATWYRRSYGRLYEATVCVSHQTDDKYTQLYNTRPTDIIGRHVRLEVLEQERHVQDLFNITSGDAVYDNKAYDPNQIWSFMQDGPFVDAASLGRSFVFCHELNEAAFGVRHNVTDRLVGAILLTHDDPLNLSCQLEPPIMHPQHDQDNSSGTSLEQLECCFLLMDRLFAHGYRRIQIAIDSQDAHKRKWAVRLGFTLEGCLFKHMVVKESSRDSNIYGLLNNDWKRGARSALFMQLYGKTALRADLANEKRHEEWEEQQRYLDEKKRLEKEASATAATTTTTNKDKKV